MKFMCVLAILLIAFSANAQKKEKTFAGIIKYGITFESDQELDAQTKAQLPNELLVYVKDGRVRQEQKSAMYSMASITTEKGDVIILMDVMGQKIATRQVKEEIDKSMEEAKSEGELSDLDYKMVEEYKTIAGYKCQKVEVVDPQGETAEIFVTNEIPVHNSYNDLTMYKGLKGVPLEYVVSQQGFVMTFTAKEVKKGGVNDAMFKITDDYNELSIEEFSSMFGGGM